MLHMHQYVLAASAAAAGDAKMQSVNYFFRSEVSGRDVQFKQDQSAIGVCHICPPRRGCSDSQRRLFPSVAPECLTSSQRNNGESAS